MIQKLKILVTDPVLDVALAASEEVVNDGDFMSLDHQLVNQMRANEPSSARHLHSTQYFRQPQSSAVSQRYSIHNMRLETRYSYKSNGRGERGAILPVNKNSFKPAYWHIISLLWSRKGLV